MHSQSEIFARAIKTLYEIKIDLIEIIHEDAGFANEEPDLIVKIQGVSFLATYCIIGCKPGWGEWGGSGVRQ